MTENEYFYTMSIGNKYTIHQTVQSGSIDGKCRATIMSFLSLAQDLASSHYGTGGRSIPHLQKEGFTWVVTKQHFEVREYPLWLDAYKAVTWAKKPRGPFCYRNFAYSYEAGGKYATIDDAFAAQIASASEVQGSAGCSYGALPAGLSTGDSSPAQASAGAEGTGDESAVPFFTGSSLWMVLDLSTGRPVKMTDELMGSLAFCDEPVSGEDMIKIHDPEEWTYCHEFSPTNLDIDLNSHVNNLAYDRWILSFLPENAYKGKLVRAIDTYFIAQAMFGDELVCRTAEIEPDVWVHSIIRKADGAEMFRARTEWASEWQISRPVTTR